MATDRRWSPASVKSGGEGGRVSNPLGKSRTSVWMRSSSARRVVAYESASSGDAYDTGGGSEKRPWRDDHEDTVTGSWYSNLFACEWKWCETNESEAREDGSQKDSTWAWTSFGAVSSICTTDDARQWILAGNRQAGGTKTYL